MERTTYEGSQHKEGCFARVGVPGEAAGAWLGESSVVRYHVKKDLESQAEALTIDGVRSGGSLLQHQETGD